VSLSSTDKQFDLSLPSRFLLSPPLAPMTPLSVPFHLLGLTNGQHLRPSCVPTHLVEERLILCELHAIPKSLGGTILVEIGTSSSFFRTLPKLGLRLRSSRNPNEYLQFSFPILHSLSSPAHSITALYLAAIAPRSPFTSTRSKELKALNDY
jgi:hypothetical protein